MNVTKITNYIEMKELREEFMKKNLCLFLIHLFTLLLVMFTTEILIYLIDHC